MPGGNVWVYFTSECALIGRQFLFYKNLSGNAPQIKFNEVQFSPAPLFAMIFSLDLIHRAKQLSFRTTAFICTVSDKEIQGLVIKMSIAIRSNKPYFKSPS